MQIYSRNGVFANAKSGDPQNAASPDFIIIVLHIERSMHFAWSRWKTLFNSHISPLVHFHSESSGIYRSLLRRRDPQLLEE